MSRVYVVGSFITDLTVRTSHLPVPGETVLGDSFEIFPGGKGFNQAVAARRAGAATSMIGALGDDQFAELFWDAFRSEGINAESVRTVKGAGTGVGIPIIDHLAQNAIVIVPQANSSLCLADVERGLAGLTSSDAVLLQLEIPLETTVAAAELAHARGARVILNPAPYQTLPGELLQNLDILVLNEIELAGLAGKEREPIESAMVRAASTARNCDLIVTLGDQGVRVLHRNTREVASFQAHMVEAVDTVGAGDVFCGNLAASIARGADLIEAAGRANAAAALAVTRTGSALAAPAAAEVDTSLALVEGPSPRMKDARRN